MFYGWGFSFVFTCVFQAAALLRESSVCFSFVFACVFPGSILFPWIFVWTFQYFEHTHYTGGLSIPAPISRVIGEWISPVNTVFFQCLDMLIILVVWVYRGLLFPLLESRVCGFRMYLRSITAGNRFLWGLKSVLCWLCGWLVVWVCYVRWM